MTKKWAHQNEADDFDNAEHPLSDMVDVRVRRRKLQPKNALAVRFEVTDLDRIRKRAEAESVGVTQLIRSWVLERLDEPESSTAVQDLMESLEKSVRAARALKRASRKAG
ncbi:MAG: hypothetical protein ACYDD6_08055 [Acidimicrobiales bacterium]